MSRRRQSPRSALLTDPERKDHGDQRVEVFRCSGKILDEAEIEHAIEVGAGHA